MGSNTPLVEKLAVGLWTDASRQETRKETVAIVKYRMESKPEGFESKFMPVEFRHEGEYEIGEGFQYVNGQSIPVWVVVRDAPGKNITVAYMVWKKESSLKNARGEVDAAIAAFGRKGGEVRSKK